MHAIGGMLAAACLAAVPAHAQFGVPWQQLLSLSILNRRGAPVQVPQSLRGLPGELNIVLADSNFISFTGPFDPDGKRVVGIKGAGHYPLTLPNVARNLIADTYQSGEARFFPLTDEERRRLRAMYPAR